MSSSTIRDMNSLDREIRLRQARLKQIEKSLSQNLEELPGQVPRMALYAFLGRKKGPAEPMGFAGQLMGMAMDNEKLQSSLAVLIDTLAEKLGIGLEKLTEAVRKRRRKSHGTDEP